MAAGFENVLIAIFATSFVKYVKYPPMLWT
jgi:hypothetical protein